MANNQEVLISTGVIAEVPDGNESARKYLDAVTDQLRAMLQPHGDTDVTARATGVYSFDYLGAQDLNAQRCSCCNRWATDEGLPDAVRALPSGRRVESVFLCDDCRMAGATSTPAES